jgi:hypothetical protein
VNFEKANKTAITWVAYNENYGAEVEQEFAIYFDPFKNSSLESKNGNPKNQVTSPKLGDYDIPLAEYKYTIVGTNYRGQTTISISADLSHCSKPYIFVVCPR